MGTIVDGLITIGNQNMNEWEPKLEGGRDIGTGSLPKSRNRQGEGRSIVPASRNIGNYKLTNLSVMGKRGEVTRSYSSTKNNNLDNEYPGLKGLEKLKKEINENKKVKNIYKRYILDKDIHITAYHKISENKGGMTPGIDEETLDGITENYINETIGKLKDHTFKFRSYKAKLEDQPSRREWILKANGKKRLLGIPSPRDKIVQKVMVIILEMIYESSIFIDNSHGFRPNRSTHTALEKIGGWKNID